MIKGIRVFIMDSTTYVKYGMKHLSDTSTSVLLTSGHTINIHVHFRYFSEYMKSIGAIDEFIVGIYYREKKPGTQTLFFTKVT